MCLKHLSPQSCVSTCCLFYTVSPPQPYCVFFSFFCKKNNRLFPGGATPLTLTRDKSGKQQPNEVWTTRTTRTTTTNISMSGRWLQHNDASAHSPAKPSKSGAAANFPPQEIPPNSPDDFSYKCQRQAQNGAISFFFLSCWARRGGGLVACLSATQPRNRSLL